MRSSPLYTVCGLLLMGGALAVNLLTLTSASRRLPRRDTNAFPRQVGEWRSDADRPFAELVHSTLPTASLIDRVYANAQGETVELALVSAADSDDAHSPETCLRAGGWKLENLHSRALDGQVTRCMRAALNGQQMEVLFWWDAPNAPASRWISRLQKLRLETLGHGTILVRLTAPASAHSEAALRAFAHQLLPALAAWKQAGKG